MQEKWTHIPPPSAQHYWQEQAHCTEQWGHPRAHWTDVIKLWAAGRTCSACPPYSYSLASLPALPYPCSICPWFTWFSSLGTPKNLSVCSRVLCVGVWIWQAGLSAKGLKLILGSFVSFLHSWQSWRGVVKSSEICRLLTHPLHPGGI